MTKRKQWSEIHVRSANLTLQLVGVFPNKEVVCCGRDFTWVNIISQADVSILCIYIRCGWSPNVKTGPWPSKQKPFFSCLGGSVGEQGNMFLIRGNMVKLTNWQDTPHARKATGRVFNAFCGVVHSSECLFSFLETARLGLVDGTFLSMPSCWWQSLGIGNSY